MRWQGPLALDGTGPIELAVRRLSSRPFRGPVVVRLEAKVGGRTQRSLNATVDTRHYRKVLVAGRGLRRGEEVEPDLVDWAERDITDQKAGYFTDVAALEGMRMRRPMSLGQILTHRHIEKQPLHEEYEQGHEAERGQRASEQTEKPQRFFRELDEEKNGQHVQRAAHVHAGPVQPPRAIGLRLGQIQLAHAKARALREQRQKPVLVAV